MENREYVTNIYDFLKRNDEDLRSIAIISEKQLVFVSQIHKDNEEHHSDIILDTISLMYPSCDYKVDKLYQKAKNDIFIGLGDGAMNIFIPEDCIISTNQFKMINYMLNEIDKYNTETPNNKVTIDFDGKYYEFKKKDNMNDVLDSINKYVNSRNNQYKSSEKIIGIPLDEIDKLMLKEDENITYK